MDEMTTHEQISELLPGYVRGHLPREEADTVATHLEGCPDCASEHRALIAIQGPDPEPLTEIERARMRRAVLEEAVPVPDADPAPSPSPAKARLFPLLGAAALVVLVAVFAYIGLGDGGGSDDGEGATAVSEADRDDDVADSGAGGGDGSVAEDAAALEGPAAAGAARSKAPPRPQFKASIGKVDSKHLNNLGRRGLPLVVFSRSYTTNDVERLRDDYTERLARSAPNARAEQLRECIAQITSNFPTALPAYSGVGEFTDEPQREVLMVAFAWTDETKGPLDQSMVWAWPLGSCDSVAHYSKNVIEPRS